MTLLERSRTRSVVASASFVGVLALALFCTRFLAHVEAAKRIVVAQEARATAENVAGPGGGAAAPPTPVLVELFTSEGCSSCPPADALLARLQHDQPVRGAEIVVLEEHVDYWDELGWHDRFSGHQYTQRQSAYAQRFHIEGDYTPQMVVDGADQFVGNDSGHALRAITQAARTMKLGLAVSSAQPNAKQISITVTVPLPGGPVPAADLYAVLVEPMASTAVQRGENGGRTLHHVSVVRSLQRVGRLESLRGPTTTSLDLPKDADPAKLHIVVFAQRADLGPVVAIATTAAATAEQAAAAQIAAR